jgi:hypothetical protein
VAYG